MSKRVLIVSDTIGEDTSGLGAILMKNFLYSVARDGSTPKAIMLMNGGVRLACEGSTSLDDLRILAENGVPVKVCGTCLDFLGLMDQLEVGEVGTMSDGVAAMLGDDAVLTVG